MPAVTPIDIRSQVAIYRQRGWYCVPLKPRSKSPSRRDWTNLRLAPDVFPDNCNVGIILGEPSGWLVDVDLDCAEAIELSDQYLPPTPAITGRPSSPKSHRWYIAANATTEKHQDPNNGSMIVELRSTGGQTVVGPSIHPDGEPYDVLDAEPATVPAPLSKRMLTNGFFARLNIIDVGRRGKGQTPGSARDLPDDILEIAKWWTDFEPGEGNFLRFHPKPIRVAFTNDAERAINELRLQTETEYDKAEDAGDEAARAAWSRTCEHAKKLALIYACSENHEHPEISLDAVQWASEFALHQTRRQLYLASVHVAENPFHAECLKFKKKLDEQPGKMMQRRELMRSLKNKAADFDQIVLTLVQQGDIESVTIETKTKPAQGYRLVAAE